MEGLAALPVFFNLKGKRVALAGGSPAALWKAELAQAAGAEVDVYAAEPCAGLIDLARRRPSVRLARRAFQPDDLKGAALAIADVDSAAEAEAFRAAARASGAPANIIDKPACSDFQFGAIVDRSPLVIAISSDGASPILTQALRGRIEAVLPAAIKLWARAAKGWREPLKALALGAGAAPPLLGAFQRQSARRRLRAAGRRALRRASGAGSSAIRARRRARVALVGAGPGDPELLTLKALRMLQSADVVLYDDLVAPAIVDMARREAEKIPVGKRGYKPSCKQDRIVALMIELARSRASGSCASRAAIR